MPITIKRYDLESHVGAPYPPQVAPRRRALVVDSQGNGRQLGFRLRDVGGARRGTDVAALARAYRITPEAERGWEAAAARMYR